jgi:aspartyl-tRNA(Asn)/glutamyl-tRNA(Gln) amidotransferase subunit B
VELKNINSFRFAKAAMEYEIKRQEKILSEGGKILQETRLWNPDKGETAPMRSKEEAHDYRYFPDPDLVPLRVTAEMVDDIRKTLPELPAAKHKRYVEEFGFSDYSIGVLADNKRFLEYFEKCVAEAEKLGLSKMEVGKELANCITIDFRGLTRKMNSRPGITQVAAPVLLSDPVFGEIWPGTLIPEKNLVELVAKKVRGEISGPIYKSVLEEMFFRSGKTAPEIMEEKGLTQVSDEGALEKIIDEVMAKNPAQLAQYRSGKAEVFGFFVGQVMKASGGMANPTKVNELLKRKLCA